MKRKNSARIRTFCLIFAILSAFVFTAESMAYDATGEASIGDTDISTSDVYTDITEENTAAEDSEAIEPEKTENSSFLDTVWAGLEANQSNILSALSLIGSIILMLGYKKGLIPLLSDGISAITSVTKRMSEKTGELGEKSAELIEDTKCRIDALRDMLLAISEKVDKMEGNAEREGEMIKQANLTKAVLAEEIDMLYEIFMAAALPQYLKDNVGERVCAMKRQISQSEGSQDEKA